MTVPTKFSGNVDSQDLRRLHQLAVDALGHDGGTRDQQLKALAAHHLNQHGKLQLAAAQHLEGVGGIGLFHADGDVGQQLALQPILDVAAGDVLAFASAEGRVVDRKVDRDGGLVDGDDGQRLRVFKRAEALADGDAGDARNGDDIAHLGLGRVLALEAVEGEKLGHLDRHERAVELRKDSPPGRSSGCR